MKQSELEESIQWEVEQFIPFNIKDVYIDAKILNSTTSSKGQMEVALVAAKKEYVDSYIDIFKKANLPYFLKVHLKAVKRLSKNGA